MHPGLPRSILALLGLLVAAGSAHAQGNASAPSNASAGATDVGATATTFEFEAGESPDSTSFWFTLKGSGERNPEIEAPPGSTVVVEFKNTGAQIHNIHFASPVSKATPLLDPGQNATLRFVAPLEAGKIEYYCDPHRTLGMKGTFVVASAAVTPENRTNETTPSPEAVDEARTPAPPLVVAVAAALVGAFLRNRRGR